VSYEAVRWALYDAPMLLTSAGKPDATARLVLIARAERADKHGRNTYAGPADLMKSTGLDERTIQRADRRLEESGQMIRDGISHVGTVRWRLAMTLKQSDTEKATADPRIERRREADKERMRRHRDRQKAVAEARTEIAVTDSASVTSRTLNPNVTDSASVRHGFNAPQTTNEPPREPPVGTTPGGTLPPDPLRPPSPSAQGTEPQPSITESLTPAQDQQGDPLPHANARDPSPAEHLATVTDFFTREAI
jgi:hypothetical protein